MYLDREKKLYLQQIIFRAAHLPTFLLLLGSVFIALSYVDNFFFLTEYKYLFDITDNVGAIFIALAVLTFIYSCLVSTFLHYERKFYTDHHVAALILASIRKSLRIVFLLALINIVISLSGMTKYYLIMANNIINMIIIASLGWIAIQILYTFDAIVFKQASDHNNKDYKRAKSLYTKTHIIRNILTVIIVLLTFAAILMSFKNVRSIGISLLASAGFLTAIIGLASQKALFSMFSGLQIALSQPIKIGDIITIENETGVIEEITFSYIRIKLSDRRRMLLPIQQFMEKPFLNWSHDPEGISGNITLFIDYLLPIQPLREHFEKMLGESKYWDGKTGKLQVANLAERSVELHIMVSAADEDNLGDLRAEIKEKILVFIREHYPEYFPAFRFDRPATS